MSNFLENACLNNSDGMNTLLESYLEELDSWQRGVHNIKIMHHDIWKEVDCPRIQSNIELVAEWRGRQESYLPEARRMLITCLRSLD